MRTRLILLAMMALMTIGTISAQDGLLTNKQVSLEELAAYIDTMRNPEAAVKLFYTNLVNNPTHSYRI